MKVVDFISGLQEELELDTTLELNTNIKDLEEWDSMTAMLLIGYVSNECNITLTSSDLEGITSIDSLIERIGVDKFD